MVTLIWQQIYTSSKYKRVPVLSLLFDRAKCKICTLTLHVQYLPGELEKGEVSGPHYFQWKART